MEGNRIETDEGRTMDHPDGDRIEDGVEETLSVAELGRDVVALEIEGLEALRDGIGQEFEEAVGLLLGCRGKVIVCGIGKSGIVARKIAATLSSTGTPAVYLHPVEAAHGDMGMVTGEDVFIAVSKSGDNEEINKLLPFVRAMKVKMISITTAEGSQLAGESDILLLTRVEREACPMDMVPTSSTTAALVMGDALAVAVFRRRNFGKEDFARLHPSGNLGKRLHLKVSELMHTAGDLPLVDMDTSLKDALIVIINKRLGITGVVDEEGTLAGVITDGDLKRYLVKNSEILDVEVARLMTRSPRTTVADALAIDALAKMEMDPPGPVTQLFVIDDEHKPIGVIHIHDIIRAGLR